MAHHAGSAWSSEADLTKFVEKFLKGPSPWSHRELPRVFINLSYGTPELDRYSRNPDEAPFASALWNAFFERRDEVAIVMSLSAFRSEGGMVTRRLSWEQGVEDLAAELHLFPRLAVLSRFRHLFVRTGMVGFVHFENDPSAPRPSKLCGRVYFSPYAKDGIHRDHETEGATFGRNVTFLAALAREYAGSKKKDACFASAIRDSLVAIRKVDDAGFGSAMKKDGRDFVSVYVEPARKLLLAPDKVKPDSSHVTSSCSIPEHVLSPPPPNALRSARRWHILDDMLKEAPVHRINIAMAIVKLGHERVFNRTWPDVGGNDRGIYETLTRVEYWNPNDRAPDFVTLEDTDWPSTPPRPGADPPATPAVIGDLSRGFSLDVPVASFGKATLVERDEIENLRGISNLIKSYRERVERMMKDERKHASPLSIAVFGPPGSGKSFAVKQMAKTIGKKKMPELIFNVSQLSSTEGLAAAFKLVKKKRNETRAGRRGQVTPLVFFDEFDCPQGDRQLGWLKSFLAPMQDGEFEDMKDIGPAIFVFAGGVYPSFERFDPSTDNAYDNLRDSPDYKERARRFGEQKGPDFTSRLRGHINVLGINDVPGRFKHFIRRAIQLRGLLEGKKFLEEEGKEKGRAKIDDGIIYALLTVDQYRHGVRSMEAIIEMCSPIHGRIEIASLPSSAQLDMHVDARELLIRVSRGRARAQGEWAPDPVLELERFLGGLGTQPLPPAVRESLAAKLKSGVALLSK
jgi:hypothetical protein